MKNSVCISIVVPVYNEESQIIPFTEVTEKIFDKLSVDYEFIFIDDGSTDETWGKLLELVRKKKCIRTIRLSRNFGKESALCAGLEEACGDGIVTMDVDFQHPPELLPEMIRLWKDNGYKIVEARKINRGREALLKGVISKTFYALINQGTDFDLTGATDYKLLDRTVINIWKSLPERVTFFRGMCAWMGFNKAVVDFTVPQRTVGKSRWSYLHLIRLAFNAISSFTALPLYAVAVIGIVFLFFAIALGTQTLFMYLSGKALDGFTTVILLQLIIGAGVMLGLGIAGIYIARLYEEAKARPRYVISERANFPDIGRI